MRPLYSRSYHVTNIFTKKEEAEEDTWFPSPSKNGYRKECFEATSAKGQKEDHHQGAEILMLARRQRLPAKEFPQRGSLSLRSAFFSVKASDNSWPYNRFAVVIGKSAVKKATRRHYLKRIVVSWLAQKPNKGKDILILVQKPAEGATKAMINEGLEKTLTPLF